MASRPLAEAGSFYSAGKRLGGRGPGPHLHQDAPQAAQRWLQTPGGTRSAAGQAALPAPAG